MSRYGDVSARGYHDGRLVMITSGKNGKNEKNGERGKERARDALGRMPDVVRRSDDCRGGVVRAGWRLGLECCSRVEDSRQLYKRIGQGNEHDLLLVHPRPRPSPRGRVRAESVLYARYPIRWIAWY